MTAMSNLVPDYKRPGARFGAPTVAATHLKNSFPTLNPNPSE